MTSPLTDTQLSHLRSGTVYADPTEGPCFAEMLVRAVDEIYALREIVTMRSALTPGDREVAAKGREVLIDFWRREPGTGINGWAPLFVEVANALRDTLAVLDALPVRNHEYVARIAELEAAQGMVDAELAEQLRAAEARLEGLPDGMTGKEACEVVARLNREATEAIGQLDAAELRAFRAERALASAKADVAALHADRASWLSEDDRKALRFAREYLDSRDIHDADDDHVQNMTTAVAAIDKLLVSSDPTRDGNDPQPPSATSSRKAYREDVPCEEDEHDWPDGDWPAYQVSDRDDVVQCNNCLWTRLEIATHAGRVPPPRAVYEFEDHTVSNALRWAVGVAQNCADRFHGHSKTTFAEIADYFRALAETPPRTVTPEQVERWADFIAEYEGEDVVTDIIYKILREAGVTPMREPTWSEHMMGANGLVPAAPPLTVGKARQLPRWLDGSTIIACQTEGGTPLQYRFVGGSIEERALFRDRAEWSDWRPVGFDTNDPSDLLEATLLLATEVSCGK